MELLLGALEREEKNLNGYFIDGYPRTVEQLDQFKQKVTNLFGFPLTWLVKGERLRGQCHAIFSNTLKIKNLLFG